MGTLTNKSGRDELLEGEWKELTEEEKQQIQRIQDENIIKSKEHVRRKIIKEYAKVVLGGLISHYGSASPKAQAKSAFEVALAMYEQEIELFEK